MKSLTISLAVFLLAIVTFTNVTAKKLTIKEKTIENLKAAFEGETTASAKYDAYSKKAKRRLYKNSFII